MFGRWGKKKTEMNDQADVNDEQGSQQGSRANESEKSSELDAFNRGVILDSVVVASVFEKASLLKMFNELRTEGTFCDVAFLCQGVLFRAHKIVVR